MFARWDSTLYFAPIAPSCPLYSRDRSPVQLWGGGCGDGRLSKTGIESNSYYTIHVIIPLLQDDIKRVEFDAPPCRHGADHFNFYYHVSYCVVAISSIFNVVRITVVITKSMKAKSICG